MFACRSFWNVVMEMTVDLQKHLLLFATGSDRVPVGGMSEMQFKITRVDNINMWVINLFLTDFNKAKTFETCHRVMPDSKSMTYFSNKDLWQVRPVHQECK